MKKLFIIFAAATALFACKKENIDEIVPSTGEENQIISFTVPAGNLESGDATKLCYNDALGVLWQAGDVAGFTCKEHERNIASYPIVAEDISDASGRSVAIFSFPAAAQKNWEIGRFYTINISLQSSKAQVHPYLTGEYNCESHSVFNAEELILADGIYSTKVCIIDGESVEIHGVGSSTITLTAASGSGYYEVKVNADGTGAELVRQAPYFVGGTNPERWNINDENGGLEPLQMEEVAGQPGLFHCEIDWGNNGGDFKFQARNDTWDFSYRSSDNQVCDDLFGFNKSTVKDSEIVFGKSFAKDCKWKVENYGCYPSVSLILDTKNMTLYCVPIFSVAGGNWDGASWLQNHDNNWSAFSAAHQMTIDYANKLSYYDVTVTDANNTGDFKIFSKGTSGYEYDKGVWLIADWHNKWVKPAGHDNINKVIVAESGDDDDKWIFKKDEDNGNMRTGNLRIVLDWSDWHLASERIDYGIRLWYEERN